MIFGSVGSFIINILTFALLLIRGRMEDICNRYSTTDSEGPKHQLQIYWQNASEWAVANPQDTKKWKVRIDDQAIICGALRSGRRKLPAVVSSAVPGNAISNR